MTTYLVTGGAGFIGSSIARRLVTSGARVRVIDNLATGFLENLEGVHDEVEFLEGDIRDPVAVEIAMRDVDFVLHQAALPSVARSVKDPRSTNDTNVTGTLNVLEGAVRAGVHRVVYASSSSVYGDTPELPKREDMTPNPRSPYAVSKLAGEHYCRAYMDVYGLETVALRYFNVFGPRQSADSQYSAVVPIFARAIASGQRPRVYGDGEQSRDFTYVDNVVEANVRACQSQSAAGQMVNIACGERTSVNALIAVLCRALGRETEPEYVDARSGDVRHSRADVARAGELIGYEPKISLEEGLSRLCRELAVPSVTTPVRGG